MTAARSQLRKSSPTALSEQASRSMFVIAGSPPPRCQMRDCKSTLVLVTMVVVLESCNNRPVQPSPPPASAPPMSSPPIGRSLALVSTRDSTLNICVDEWGTRRLAPGDRPAWSADGFTSLSMGRAALIGRTPTAPVFDLVEHPVVFLGANCSSNITTNDSPTAGSTP